MQPRSTPQRTSRTHRPLNGSPETVRIRVLGGFSVSVGFRNIHGNAWRLRKAANLVKLLAVSPGHRMHREQIMEALWPELGTRAASNNLRGALHVARRVFDPEPSAASGYLTLQEEQVALCPGGQLRVDVEAFEEAAAAARRSQEPAAYRTAIELYSGELLPEDRYEEWAEERRGELHKTYLSLLVELSRLYEVREDLGLAIEALQRAVVGEPTHEGAHTGLIRLYALSGRPGEALAHYERLREDLLREFATEPGAEIQRIYKEVLSGRISPARTSLEGDRPVEEPTSAAAHNLPAARTSFVGRERELVEVKRELAMTSLLTLTGAGGTGKTRLALELARELAPAYRDGVWLVELAGLSEPGLVPNEVAGVLSVRDQPGRPLLDALVDALRSKRMLLILDNCEHLAGACVEISEALLDSSPGLQMLATSREPLVTGIGTSRMVAPLAVPESQQKPTVEDLAGYASARLFVERARDRNPTFTLTSQNTEKVAEVCRMLDGIPLAIELTAARMDILTLEQIAERLDHALGFLSGGRQPIEPRHRTLRATLGWSYDLLGEPERRLFTRLSMFAGGFSLEAAEAVGAGEGVERTDVLESFLALADKSLVVAVPIASGAVRYRMLEPIRQYAQERLEEGGEAEAIHHRHATFFLELAERAEPHLKGPGQVEWLKRLEEDNDNLRTALLWMLEREGLELSLRFGATLGEFWYMRGHLSEGRRWLETALAKGDAPSVARVRALAKASWIATEQANLERATALGEQGLELARKLGDEDGTATALLNLGMAVMGRGQLERSTALLEEGLLLFRGLGDKWGLARSLLSLGFVAMFQGDEERAEALIEECLAVSRESGDVWSSGGALIQMALMALLREDYGRSEALCKESLELSRRSGMQHHITIVLHTSAALAGSRGQPLRSARLWGTAEALREAMGTVFTPLELQTYGPYIAAARAQVEEAAWEAAWQKGRAMSMEEVIDYVLLEGEEPADTTAPARKGSSIPAQTTTLTRREQEVAALVARGLTNRQIAAELSISEHTVANHVGKSMRKLGLRSRSRLAAWTAERQQTPSSD